MAAVKFRGKESAVESAGSAVKRKQRRPGAAFGVLDRAEGSFDYRAGGVSRQTSSAASRQER